MMNYFIPNEIIKLIAFNLDNLNDILMFSISCKKYYNLLWTNEFRLHIMKKKLVQPKIITTIKLSETGEPIYNKLKIFYCLKCGETNHIKINLVYKCYNCSIKTCNNELYREYPCQSINNKLCIKCIKQKGNYIESTQNTTITKEMYNSIHITQKENFYQIK